MIERLEDSKNMEVAERVKLEEEIKAKQDEVERIRNEVEEKDQETRRLQVSNLLPRAITFVRSMTRCGFFAFAGRS